MKPKQILSLSVGRLSLFLAAMTSSSVVFAWGQYGHEQVNSAAIDVLDSSAGIGKCLQQPSVRYLMTRYAITPDVEWKADMNLPKLAAADKSARMEADRCEHPLHFFEADAFAPNPQPGDIANLPSGAYNADISDSQFANYTQLLSKNASYVTTVDPSKKLADPSQPTASEVLIHGTAPWRAQQLFNMAVNSLKKKDVKTALLYLGTMGHYVGDMSQPFHASLNYDGLYYPPPTSQATLPHDGIHHMIDTDFLPSPSKDSNDVYQDFSETSSAVLSSAKTRASAYSSTIPSTDIPKLILAMVDKGYPELNNLLQAYGAKCAEANGISTASLKNSKKKVASKTTPITTTIKRTIVTVANAPQNSGSAGEGGHGIEPFDEKTDKVGQIPYCVDVPTTTASGKSRDRFRELSKADREAAQQADVNGEGSLRQVLSERLASSSALLAKLWQSAYAAAGSPDLSTSCSDNMTFDQSFAIQNYPKPDYYGSAACVK